MTLQQYKVKNKKELAAKWYGGANEKFANFESFCFHEWQFSGVECTYGPI